MKKLYFLMVTILVTSLSFGQTTVFQESFETGNSFTASETCSDGSGDFFTRTDGSDIGSYYEVSGQDGSYYFAAMDTDGSPCTLPTQTLTYTGIDISSYTNLTFAMLVAEDDASDGNEDWDADTAVTISVSIDGTPTNILQFSGGGATNTEPGLDTDFDGVADSTMLSPAFQEFTAAIGNGSTADITITFNFLNAGDEDIAIDNIRIIDGYVLSPSLAITSPAEATIFNPETTAVDVELSVQNFVVATAGNGDGHIHYAVDGGSNVMKFDTNPISLTGLASGAHSVYVELVDDNHDPLSPEVNTTVNFTIATYTQVANLADLRAGTIGNYYEVTGEVIGTYAQAYHNQKWAQDATAGILIDDNAGVIATVYNEFDGVTGLKGKLDAYNGLLQIIPSADPGAATSTGNTITPEVVTIDVLNSNLATYESELIEILAADITDFSGGDGTFQTGKNYDITDASGTGVLRTNFYGADYIGSALPTAATNYVCLVGSYNGTTQVTPRNAADMVLGLSQQTIEGFGLFPNPVTNGMLRITTQNSLEKNIQIFDILGKQVFTQTTSAATINVSDLNSGIYIIRVEEAGRLATRKLVIK
jgi:hypothetical protein